MCSGMIRGRTWVRLILTMNWWHSLLILAWRKGQFLQVFGDVGGTSASSAL